MTATATLAPPRTQFHRMSSVLLVDRIEPCLEFWVDRLGFEVRLQVHGDDHLEFVSLGRDDVEFLFRTRDSLREDAPVSFDEGRGGTPAVIYLQVDDLDEVLPRLVGVEILVPMRETFLGARELYVREPSGRILALSCRD